MKTKPCVVCSKPMEKGMLNVCSPKCDRIHKSNLKKAKELKVKEKKQKIKLKKKFSISTLSKRADDLWSKVIKLAGKCEYCGGKDYLNSHHIFTRHSKSTRWSLINGISLCPKHHVFSDEFSAHKTPVEFTYWLEEYKGKPCMDELRLKINLPLKVTPEMLLNTIDEFQEILDNQLN